MRGRTPTYNKDGDEGRPSKATKKDVSKTERPRLVAAVVNSKEQPVPGIAGACHC